MTPRNKPGTLAFLRNSVFPENNGRVVEITEAYGYVNKGDYVDNFENSKWFASESNFYFHVKSITGINILFEDKTGTLFKDVCYDFISPDSKLTPILPDGDLLTDEIEEDKQREVDLIV